MARKRVRPRGNFEGNLPRRACSEPCRSPSARKVRVSRHGHKSEPMSSQPHGCEESCWLVYSGKDGYFTTHDQLVRSATIGRIIVLIGVERKCRIENTICHSSQVDPGRVTARTSRDTDKSEMVSLRSISEQLEERGASVFHIEQDFMIIDKSTKADEVGYKEYMGAWAEMLSLTPGA